MTVATRRPAPASPPAAVGVHATARMAAAAWGATTIMPVLEGDGPFELRSLRPHGKQARVCVIGAMIAPLGGDRLRIEATVRPGAALHVTTATATLALRGPTPEHATYDVHLTVEDRARLHWLPKPLICSAGSNLRQSWTIELAPTAQLVLREEQILGRAGEPPGHVAGRLTVRRGGRTLLDQQTEYGPGAPDWDGPAVLAGHRATGQLLVVDPAFEDDPPAVHLLGDTDTDTDTDTPEAGQGVLAPLAGPAVLATAVAPDSLRLRHLLDAVHTIAH
ncbi:urease accessory protein [Streptomyces aurantiacus]|uniref:urease accessory protein UreD n=1 Tax=Streptomyces aurantiacus TaxID=47760 RepID=UPI002790B8C8|nr:urease accessory protein UreD [Streptomyces aurantiacus]MDQ0775300.1 urease accessory protein [Streptomyces aurantiacus]